VEFPDDVVSLIASHLTQGETITLMKALVGCAPVSPAAVPVCLRKQWLHCDLCAKFGAFLFENLSDEVLYRTRDHASSILCIDWSVFSGPPAPVVEFFWHLRRPHVIVHYDRLLREIARCAKRRISVVRLTVHQRYVCWGKEVLQPQPVMMRVFPLIPLPALPFLTGA
jgi:hypothetical protein